MTRELVMVVRCDICGMDGAAERAVMLDGVPWEVDLCLVHHGALEALQGLLEAHGRKVRSNGHSTLRPSAAPPAEDEPPWRLLGRTCPACGLVSSTRRAFVQHARLAHQSTVIDLDSSDQRTYVCEVCGLELEAYAGMGQHVRTHRQG